MTNIPHQQTKITGTVLQATAATAGPDTVAPGERVTLLVENTGGVSTTVTVAVPGNTRYGQANPDVTTQTIPAGALAVVGTLNADLADPTDRLIDVTASPSAGVNFYAISV